MQSIWKYLTIWHWTQTYFMLMTYIVKYLNNGHLRSTEFARYLEVSAIQGIGIQILWAGDWKVFVKYRCLLFRNVHYENFTVFDAGIIFGKNINKLIQGDLNFSLDSLELFHFPWFFQLFSQGFSKYSPTFSGS